MVFRLNDEGKSGDAKAGDNIWSYEVTVPYDAVPGVYHLDFTAYDSDGELNQPEGTESGEQSSRRSGTVEVRVK